MANKKKSQIWYMDFILGVTIFLLIVVLAFKFLTQSYYISAKETNHVLLDSGKLSSSLITPGIPQNWTQDFVVVIGITTKSNVLNTTKLEYFKNMSNEDYDNVKYLFGMKSDFLIYFEINDNSVNITNQTFIGKPGITLTDVENMQPEDLLILSRFIVYRHDGIAELVKMQVVTWEE